MGFDDKWDSEVYRKSLQINRYPFDSVVSAVFRCFGSVTKRSDIRILELGCGTANNISFLAQEGFSAVGIDGSEYAIKTGLRILEEKQLSAELICQDFTKLTNFEDQSFDMVIDRGSITHNRRTDIESTISEVHRILKKDGIFLSHMFSAKSTEMQFGESLGDGSYHNISGGFYSGYPMVFFFATEEDVAELFESKFTLLSKSHLITQELMNENDYRAMWNLICKKLS